jgi:hypothetical protein
MAQLPPPPTSPDGRFYWDGERWLPMPAAPSDARRPGNHGCTIAVVVTGLAVLTLGLVVLYASTHRQAVPTSTPPNFQVVSVDTPACNGNTCVVSVVVRNEGGTGTGLLTITFTDKATGAVLTTCSAAIPSAGTNDTTKAECLLNRQPLNGRDLGGTDVKATITNNPTSR